MAASDPLREELLDKGYLILKGFLSSEECQTLNLAVFERIRSIVFKGFDLSHIPISDQINMLTDQQLRIRLLGPEAAKIVFRKGNSRQPIVSKSTGMSDQHYIPEVLKHVAFNPRLYQLFQRLYNTDRLVFRAGIERFCFKAPGATKMDEHIDRNLFDDTVNYPERFQSLITTQISETIDSYKSGTICILDGFHKYFEFARRIFHPLTGICPFPNEPASWSRFFLLKGYGKDFLRTLNAHVQDYTNFLKTLAAPAEVLDFYHRLRAEGVKVPSVPITLEWKAVRLEPGDAFIWSQDIPHYSCPNRSTIPRICFYYSAFPSPADWETSAERHWVRRQVMDLRFSYGLQANNYPDNSHNPEEIEYFRERPDEAQRVLEFIHSDVIARQLCGL